MLPIRLKVSLMAAVLVFFIIVLSMLKRRRLALKYTLLWLLTGVVMLIFVVFPELLQSLAGFIGAQTLMNTLYLLIIGFILVLLMMLTSIVSKQTERIAFLAQANAILEKRVRELEESKGREQRTGDNGCRVDQDQSVY